MSDSNGTTVAEDQQANNAASPSSKNNTTTGEALRIRTLSMAVNLLQERRALLDRFSQRRRDIDAECDYPDPKNMERDYYQTLYDWEPIPARVVEVYPKESWQVEPRVYESEDAQVLTPFEKAWNALGDNLRGGQSWYKGEDGNPVLSALLKVDIASGIDSWGVIVVGVEDGLPLSEPLQGVVDPDTDYVYAKPVQRTPTVTTQPKTTTSYGDGTDYYSQTGQPTPASTPTATPTQPTKSGTPPSPSEQGVGGLRKLTFLRVYSQTSVKVSRTDKTKGSPRRGMPTEYTICLQDRNNYSEGAYTAQDDIKVHWTRVIHVADNTLDSEWCGVPRMQPVLRRLLDLRKLYGGSAEMYWQGALPGWSVETNPQLGSDVQIDQEAVRQAFEDRAEGLQRVVTLEGMSAKSLAPQVVAPDPQIKVQLEAICIRLGIPMRIFLGSERGELASSQDDVAWNDRLKQRQSSYITPRIICPLVDRLIACGVLPVPKDGYKVYWPDLTSKSDKEKADTALVLVQCITTYVSGNGEAVFPLSYFLTRILGLTDEEANDIITEAEQIQQEKEQAAAEATLKQMEQQAKLQQQNPGQPQVDGTQGNPLPPNDGGGNAPVKPKPTSPVKPTGNVFCPTGEGGGIDATCSPGESGGGTDAGGKPAEYKSNSEADKAVGPHYDKWSKSLTSNERNALDNYVHDEGPGGWRELNQQMRHGEPDAAQSALMDHIKSAIDKSPGLPHDTVAYRGVGQGINLKEGSEFVDHAFVSTSLVKHVGESMAEKGGGLLKILLPKGHKGAYVPSALHQHHDESESEFLLPFGTKFRVGPTRGGVTTVTVIGGPGMPTGNAFCATGPGGGIDATCSPGNASEGGSKDDSGGHVAKDVTVHVHPDAQSKIKSLFGKDLDHATLAAIGSAVDGSTVSVTVSGGKLRITSEKRDPTTGELVANATREIYKPLLGLGKLTAKNVVFGLRGDTKGLGIKVFGAQVKALREAGVKEITTNAAGAPEAYGGGGNGFYTWPRFGYTGTIRENVFSRLPKEFKDQMGKSREVQDLFDKPGGAEAWKAHGDSIPHMRFDLAKGSRSSKALSWYEQQRLERERKIQGQ